MNDQTPPNPIQTGRPLSAELPRHITFLLRLWQVDETASSSWRAALEMPETGERLGFATLEQLFVYLADFCEGHNQIKTDRYQTDRQKKEKK